MNKSPLKVAERGLGQENIPQF
jgi:hypothetical protein